MPANLPPQVRRAVDLTAQEEMRKLMQRQIALTKAAGGNGIDLIDTAYAMLLAALAGTTGAIHGASGHWNKDLFDELFDKLRRDADQVSQFDRPKGGPRHGV